MDPEQRLLVVVEHLAVKVTVFLIGALVRMLAPQPVSYTHLLNHGEGENTNKICEQLYDLALLAHGSLSPERMTGFVARTNEIMMMLAEK